MVDAADLKSADRKVVGVQVPPRALFAKSLGSLAFDQASHTMQNLKDFLKKITVLLSFLHFSCAFEEKQAEEATGGELSAGSSETRVVGETESFSEYQVPEPLSFSPAKLPRPKKDPPLPEIPLLVDREALPEPSDPSTPQEASVPPDGPKVSRYESGNVREVISYENGRKNGKYQSWHENGQLAKEGVMRDDRWNGKYREWREDGSLRLEGFYFEGMQDGEWSFYDAEGAPLPTVIFEKGIEVTRELPALGI